LYLQAAEGKSVMITAAGTRTGTRTGTGTGTTRIQNAVAGKDRCKI
jgi:hypothetical protein